MTILFLSPSDDPAEWLPELTRQIPGREIRVWPDAGDLSEIDYALAWRPPAGVLGRLPNLKVIFSLGAGVDGVLSDPDLPDKPLVRMVEPGLTEGMTEYVVLQVLHWHRQAEAYRAQQERREWRQLDQKLARERRVGVLGLGVLGADAARVLKELRFDVAGWSRSPKDLPGVTCFHGAAGLPEFLARTEILVCLLPLTPETAGILNWETLAALPRGACIINAARGGHVDESDLLAELDSGHIAGASLDVFAEEPLAPDHPFWSHPRVLVTPHVAAVTHARTAAGHIAEQIRRFEAGLPLEDLVDRTRGY
ncbi:glyoxylate/hydroxypyruvate reductase A [Skermanella sp. TT6]|uniref:Glyoxylate/hydroxypyruvate reductase A n=1 Tax=Skermanella cutis TaxID=2775420 RepID=A0ABX7B8F2_9PROT|nr:glyoxylate/hydroxypyruvate reductase A [Skermanella sp. TT6]QQP90035.1 glyoxylate/hydroxypyruvate reductase A [Skermanella sp. TT6]